MLARFAIVSLLIAVAAVVATESGAATSAQKPKRGTPALRDILEKGLRARLPREFAFIDKVVTRVEKKTLPRSLVDSTFLWARHKKPYPFPYFERALRHRAKAIGIKI